MCFFFNTAAGPLFLLSLGVFVLTIILMNACERRRSGFRNLMTGPPGEPPRPGAEQACANPACRHVNRPGARFCASCGQRFT